MCVLCAMLEADVDVGVFLCAVWEADIDVGVCFVCCVGG